MQVCKHGNNLQLRYVSISLASGKNSRKIYCSSQQIKSVMNSILQSSTEGNLARTTSDTCRFVFKTECDLKEHTAPVSTTPRFQI